MKMIEIWMTKIIECKLTELKWKVVKLKMWVLHGMFAKKKKKKKNQVLHII